MIAWILALACFFFAPAFAANPADGLTDAQLDSLVELYKDLHAHPELSFYEERTAAKLADELRGLDFEVTTRVGGHGFVAVMKNGEGPAIMLRTDLDGLPVSEQTGLPYASDVRVKDDYGADVNVMHACGHDIHMASFIGTARSLVELRGEWSGTLVMIGQPAEERGAGARRMLEDGLFERFPKPDAVLALHTSPVLETGHVGYAPGYALANVDTVDIIIRGVGGHGAWPHTAKDPIVLAAQTIMALQTIVSRETSPLDSAVVTIGAIHGGAKHNIISDEVKLMLTVRSYEDQTRKNILGSIRRIALHTARAAGVPADREPIVKIQEDEFTPAVHNSPELTGRLLPVWRELLGEEKVVEMPPVMGGEDFSRYGRTEDRIPILIYWLGTIDPVRMAASREAGGPALPSLHSPFYYPEPRESIRTGVRTMTAAALELLGR
jgi:amidohydrolase